MQALVGQRFGKAAWIAAIARRDGFEELCGFGKAAAVVAVVGLVARVACFEQSGLNPGERGGIADLGGGDADFAVLRAIVDHCGQGQAQCGVITRQPFDQIRYPAALNRIASVIDVGARIAAGQRIDRADPIERGLVGGAAGQIEPGHPAGFRAQHHRPAHRDQAADRARCIAAAQAIGTIEHALEACIERRVLRGAGDSGRTDPEAVADRDRAVRLRRRGRRKAQRESERQGQRARHIAAKAPGDHGFSP